MSVIKTNSVPELVFRQPSPSDYDHLNLLFKDSFYTYVKGTSDSETISPFDQTTLNRSELSLKEFNYVAYNKDQQFIGYIKGYYPVSGPNLWIQILAVNKPFTRIGYGKIIVKEVIQFVLTKGSVQKVFLTCHTANSVGYEFWTSIGFSPTKTIKDDHYLMEADLRSITCIPNHLKH